VKHTSTILAKLRLDAADLSIDRRVSAVLALLRATSRFG
jgi:hypothetical protein